MAHQTTEKHATPTSPGVSGAKKREFTRTPTHIAARLRSEQGEVLAGQVSDLSMKGLHFDCPDRLPLGAVCQVDILLGGEKETSSLLSVAPQIKINGQVARWTDLGMGIEVISIVGQESFAYLQQLLRHLSSDSIRIEEEIQSSSWSQTKQEHQFASASSSERH